MERCLITLAELDEHMNRRDEVVFDYLIDQEKYLFVEDLRDLVTDIVCKEGKTYAVGQEMQHPVSKYAYSPWYEVERMYLVRRHTSDA